MENSLVLQAANLELGAVIGAIAPTTGGEAENPEGNVPMGIGAVRAPGNPAPRTVECFSM